MGKRLMGLLGNLVTRLFIIEIVASKKQLLFAWLLVVADI